MLKPISLFHTPSSLEEIASIIESLSPRERALVYPYVMMMFNFLVTELGGDNKE